MINGNIHRIRNKPYPPNFSKIAAKIIDPAIGASTWAFGSHRWTENKGNFTKKAVISINHVIIDIRLLGKSIIHGIDIIRLFLLENLVIIIISKGREAVTV